MKRFAALAATVLLATAPVLAADNFDLGGAPKGDPSAVVYKFLGQYHVAVFVEGPNNLMYAQVGNMDGTGWTGWAAIGDLALKGSPDCVARNETRIDCVAKGPSDQVYWTSYSAANNSWTGWATLGGLATSNPSIVRTIDGGEQLRVFVRGPLNHLFLNTLDGGSWSDWQDLDIQVGTDISCVDHFKWGAHCFDTTGGSAVQYGNLTEKTGADIPVSDVGGAIKGKVAGVAEGPDGDLLHIFVRGPGDKLWINSWESEWSGWAQLDATVKSSPSCAMKKTGGDVWCASIRNNKVMVTLVDYGDF